MYFHNLPGVSRFQYGDRIVYMGPDKDGPNEGDVGTVMGKPRHLKFSIEKDSKGSLLYVVEFDREVGYDCPYIDERGEEKITEDDHGWVTPEIYMYPYHDPVGV